MIDGLNMDKRAKGRGISVIEKSINKGTDIEYIKEIDLLTQQFYAGDE